MIEVKIKELKETLAVNVNEHNSLTSRLEEVNRELISTNGAIKALESILEEQVTDAKEKKISDAKVMDKK